eukprot:1190189-Prorocentrum_minimum.AAC.3
MSVKNLLATVRPPSWVGVELGGGIGSPKVTSQFSVNCASHKYAIPWVGRVYNVTRKNRRILTERTTPGKIVVAITTKQTVTLVNDLTCRGALPPIRQALFPENVALLSFSEQEGRDITPHNKTNIFTVFILHAPLARRMQAPLANNGN